MSAFADRLAWPLRGLLADWSLRWGLVLLLLATWLRLRPPRPARLRYTVCLAALATGLLLPIVPRWGRGLMPGEDTPAPAARPAAEESTRPAPSIAIPATSLDRASRPAPSPTPRPASASVPAAASPPRPARGPSRAGPSPSSPGPSGCSA